MKKITDIIKKLSDKQIKEIWNILEIKEKSGNIAGLINTRLLSYTGMALLISHLTKDERRILFSGKNEAM